MLALAFVSLKTSAQQLTGKIIDSRTKEPIIGAAIAIKGTSTGVTTDVNGKFTLKTSQKPPFTILATFVGYKKKEIEIVEFENLSISLIESKGQRLDEVIVVGYGTQKEVTLQVQLLQFL